MMAMLGALFLLAVAGSAVLAEPSLTFPELARGPSRIVSGWEAEEGQLPHQLSLRMVSPAGGVSSCGGTIIHAEWGLTAAHCTAGRVTLVIRAGAVNLTRPTALFETTEYYNHPLYNEAIPGVVQPNDIGVINFNRELTFGRTIQPIRIQRSEARNQNYAGVKSIASGWGRTWTNGASPENLNWVFLAITSNAECVAAYGGSSIIQPSTICARGYNVTSQSTCQGDSGGPLTVIDDDGGLSQVGVTSFVSGTGCHTDFPAGFIRPGFYHDWYLQVTGIDFDWVYSSSEEGSPEQSGEGSEPSGEGSEPSGEGSEPSGEGSEPSGEGSEPSGEGSEPSGEGSEPSGEGSEPSGEGSEPSGESSPEQSGESSPESSGESSPESPESSGESDQSSGSSSSSSDSSD